MKKIEMIDLYDSEYNISDINALQQYWKEYQTFSCIEKPKSKNMFLYLSGCKAEYTMKNGTKCFAESDSFIYTPVGSEYRVRFYDFQNTNSHTIGVNFLLYDSHETPLVLNNDIMVFKMENADYQTIFHKLAKYSESNIICVGKLKSIMYDLLFKMSEYYKTEHCNHYRIIAKGITYLEQNEEQNLSIIELAEMCHVSETYFRRLFKEYSGMSPIEYRTHTKICKAKRYLKEQDLSIAEIAEKVGFEDVSYFIAQFHKATGMTPKKYRDKKMTVN